MARKNGAANGQVTGGDSATPALVEADPAEAAPVSLHHRISAEIEDNILSGAWPLGHRIPSEHELAEHYGCSRMTVNKVLTELAKAGLIRRKRRAGTFVTRPQSQSAVLQIRELESEVEALKLAHSHIMMERVKRRSTRGDRERLTLAESEPVLFLTCCHFAGGQPFCLEERLINLSAVPEAQGESFASSPPGTWLVRRVPWTSAEHRIRAVGATQAMGATLKLPMGTPCLVVERRTWIAERPVTFVQLIYPGDAHELVARFTPGTLEPHQP